MKVNHDNLELICSNKLGSIKYDRSNRIAVGKFEGIPTLENARELFDQVMVYAKKNPVITGFYDLTQVNGTFTSLNSYLTNQFLPVMLPLGYKYVGLVTSGNPFTKFAINALIHLAGPRGIVMKMFNDQQSCEKWIFEQEPYMVAENAK
jgi:hypothetical protein